MQPVWYTEKNHGNRRIEALQITRRIWILLLAVLLLAGLFACNRSESAPDGNGEPVDFDFSNNRDGVPDGWTVNSYEGGYTTFYEDGACGFSVGGPDDCRFVRVADVASGTRYVLTAEVRTENVYDGQGATLSIDNFAADGSFIYSEALFGTNDWTPLTLAFRTANTQESVTLALRLGGYSAESRGTVWFRNVRLAETNSAPVAFQELTPSVQTDDTEDSRTREDYENIFTVIFWAGAIAAIVLLFGVAPRINERSLLNEQRSYKYLWFGAIVLIGLIVRFILCAKLKGHSTDMSCWRGWGRMIVEGGPAKFYPDNWCDYPPGYILLLGPLYSIAGYSDGPFQLFVYMTPAFLCDVLSGFLIVNRAKRFALGDRTALILAGLIVLNPAAVYLSGAWGQIDSVLAVLLIGAFLLLNESREKPYYRLYAGILYGLAIVMKWQALIFGPVLVWMYVWTGIDQHADTRRFEDHVLWSFAGLAGAICVLVFYSLLFKGDGMGAFWMVERYSSASSGYDYASVEAYNYLALFGGNWIKAGNALFDSANVWDMFLRCNELFSKVALLIGFPTLILRAWKSMRERTDRQKNTAFYELLAAGAAAALCGFVLFISQNFTSDNKDMNAILQFSASFPLYGLLMLGVFAIVIWRACRKQSFGEWIKGGSSAAVGTAALLIAACLFGLTWILGALFRLFGGVLTWHAFGVVGIVLAGLMTVGLFFLYWIRHRRAHVSLYTNRGLIFLLAACFCVWVFTLGHYMHERYIFPALFFLVFAYAYDRDPHKLYALCMLTVTTFMNEMMAMFVVSKGANEMVRSGAIHNQLIAVISLLEVGAACCLTAAVLIRALRFDPKDPREEILKPAADTRRKKGGRR